MNLMRLHKVLTESLKKWVDRESPSSLASDHLYEKPTIRQSELKRSIAENCNRDFAIKSMSARRSNFSADVSKLSDLDGLYSKIKAEFGHLDAVFANAGYSQFGPFEAVEEDTFDKLVAVNLKGVFFTIQKAIPLLRSGSSVIIKFFSDS